MTRRTVTMVSVLALALGLAPAAVPAGATGAADEPELVSVKDDGVPLGHEFRRGEPSDDGSKVAFNAPMEENFPSRYYLRNRTTGVTTLEYSSQARSNGGCFALSGNGRYLAVRIQYFDEPGVENDDYVLLVRDLTLGQNRYVGGFGYMSCPTLSDSGRKLAFEGQPDGQSRKAIYVKNLDTGTTSKATTSWARQPVLSGDGGTLAYRQYEHLYAKTLSTGRIAKVDVRPSGAQSTGTRMQPWALSDSGRYLLFTGAASDLAPGTGACDDGPAVKTCLFRRNIAEAKTTVASVLPDGAVTTSPVGQWADLSGDGRVAAFTALPGPRVYVRVFGTATTRPADGEEHPSLTQDGGLVVVRDYESTYGEHELMWPAIWIARGR